MINKIKNYSRYALVILLPLVLISPFTIYHYLDYQDNHFSCQSQAYFYKGGSTYHVFAKYTFDDGKGVVKSVGEYVSPDKSTLKTSQIVPFTYSYKNGVLMLISESSKLAESETDLLEPLMPDFYLHKDRGYRVKMYHQGKNSLVFEQGEVPVFVCDKIPS